MKYKIYKPGTKVVIASTKQMGTVLDAQISSLDTRYNTYTIQIMNITNTKIHGVLQENLIEVAEPDKYY
jgi:hypothetical protein